MHWCAIGWLHVQLSLQHSRMRCELGLPFHSPHVHSSHFAATTTNTTAATTTNIAATTAATGNTVATVTVAGGIFADRIHLAKLSPSRCFAKFVPPSPDRKHKQEKLKPLKQRHHAKAHKEAEVATELCHQTFNPHDLVFFLHKRPQVTEENVDGYLGFSYGC